MSEYKTLSVEIKDAEQGRVEAVFATLDVIDHDKDVTVTGAFKDGQEVVIGAYNHASYLSDAPPVGKGVIREKGDQVVLNGQFFMGMPEAKSLFTSVKELGALGQWSYSYDVVDSEMGQFDGEDVRFLKGLHVHEVSPVLIGAGVGTQTVAAKTLDERKSFPDEADDVLGAVKSLVARAEAWGPLGTGQKEGRTISTANRERLGTLLNSIDEARNEIAKLLDESDPEKDRNALIREFTRFQRHVAAL